jgi:hypothetical protein
MGRTIGIGVCCVLFVGAVTGAWAGAAGHYMYKLAWTGENADNRIAYELTLGSDRVAQMTITGRGEMYADGPNGHRYGVLIYDLAKGAKVVQKGSWRENGSNVTVSFERIDTGRGGWDDQYQDMSGHMYDNNLYIDRWNHEFYGSEPRFNFSRSGGDSTSTKEAVIAGALLVGLGLLAKHDDGGQPAEDVARLKEQLQSRLNGFASAMERHDWRAMTSPMPADFRYHDLHGNVLNKDQWSIRLRDLEDTLEDPTVTMTLGQFTPGSGQANGVVTVRIESDIVHRDGTVRLEAEEKDRVYWERRGSQWVTTAVRILSLDQWIDGRKVGSASLF